MMNSGHDTAGLQREVESIGIGNSLYAAVDFNCETMSVMQFVLPQAGVF